jgi:hypothetical protein
MKLTGNTKSKLNISIDILLFVLLVTMAGIGFLMKFVVVPGEVRNEIYGNHVDLEFFGRTRHEWGHIHLIIGIIFLALLVLHIILHWRLIVSLFRCLFPARFVRYGVVGIICIIGLITLISPFILKPEIVPFEPKNRNRSDYHSQSGIMHRQSAGNELYSVQTPVVSDEGVSASDNTQGSDLHNHKDHQNSEYSEFEVYGYQTLQDVADRYDVPAAVIASDLGIPEDLAGEKLGHLRKQYSFTMTDVRKSISDYKNQNP